MSEQKLVSLSSLLALAELRAIDIERFRSLLQRVHLDEITFENGGFGYDEIRDEFWIVVLHEMRDRKILGPRSLIRIRKQNNHFKVQEEIDRLFEENINGRDHNSILMSFHGSPPPFKAMIIDRFLKLCSKSIPVVTIIDLFSGAPDDACRRVLIEEMSRGKPKVADWVALFVNEQSLVNVRSPLSQRLIIEKAGKLFTSLGRYDLELLRESAADEEIKKIIDKILNGIEEDKLKKRVDKLKSMSSEQLMELLIQGLDQQFTQIIWLILESREADMNGRCRVLFASIGSLGEQFTRFGKMSVKNREGGDGCETTVLATMSGRAKETDMWKEIEALSTEDLVWVLGQTRGLNDPPVRHVVKTILGGRAEELLVTVE